MPMCQHKDDCPLEGTEAVGIGDGRTAWVCAGHKAQIDRKLEEIFFTMQTIEIRCAKCGALAPEGLLQHDCDHPTEQPPPAELL